MTVNGVWPFEPAALNPVSTVGLTWNLVETGQKVSEELFDNFTVLYMYTVQGQGKITIIE